MNSSVETLSTFYLWTHYIGPVVFCTLVIGIFIILAGHKSFQDYRKKRFLKKNGYERYLIGVPSYGNGAFYGWKHPVTGKSIDERNLGMYTYKQFVKKMNNSGRNKRRCFDV